MRLDASGKWLSGKIVPVRLVGAGQPELDPSAAAVGVISQLSHEDIGARAARLSASGVITPPAAG